MKIISMLLIAFSLSIFALSASNEPVKTKPADSKCTINGTITDKLTGEPLAGVEVKLLDSDEKFYSDFEGKFVIKDVQAGAHSIMINYISYQDLVENVKTEKGNTTNVSIELKSVEK